MLERLTLTLVLVVIGFAAWQLFTRWQLRRAAAGDPLLADVPDGARTIVYFTTPTCAPCRLQVTPTLETLKSELGESLHIVRVDATTAPEDATRWGVLSVPTLFILGADGRPKHVHNGVVAASVLRTELASL